MRSTSLVLAAIVSASLTLPASATAQLVLTDPLHSCEYMAALSAFNPDAAACIGAYEGNNDGTGEADALAVIAAAGWGDATSLGTTQWGGDDNSGWLTFNPSLTGDYVLALKSSTYVSFYRFLGLADVSQIYYTTVGTAINPNNNRGKGLSHYTLYSTRTVSVPEPESAALLLTGLLGLGFLATRRRRENVS